MNKKVLAVAILGLAVLGFGRVASAANFASASVQVTVSGTLSMSIVGSTYTTIASVAPGGSSISGAAINVLNDSVGVIETFSLKSFDSVPWTIAAAPGTNQFTLQALFNTAAPVAADFVAGDVLTLVDKASTATVFAGTQSGLAVAPGASRNLWFRFQAPTSTSSFGSRDLTVSIVAGL
jgi:hypothetical protein